MLFLSKKMKRPRRRVDFAAIFLKSKPHRHAVMTRLLPKTRGHSLRNIASLAMSSKTARSRVSSNAVAAWNHFYGGGPCRFRWSVRALDTKTVLMCISNGPEMFSQIWIQNFVSDVVARSKLFASLPCDVLKRIAHWHN